MILKTAENLKPRVCIIGSGIAGGSLAVKFAEYGIDFLIVEAGGLNGNSSNVSYENVGRQFGLRSTTSIQLGGTSNLWHGVLSPLDEIDFKKRDWIPNSGWPVTFDDIKPYYDQAAKILKVKNRNYFDTNRLSDELKMKLNDVKFDRNVLTNKMFQQPLPEVNFKNLIIPLVEKSDKYHAILNTTALRLNRDEKGQILSLTVGCGDGYLSEIKADIFIIAAGALETPRLLLNSDIENKNIGKYLMDHPMGNLCQVQFKQEQKAHIYSAMKYQPDIAIKTGLELTAEKQEELKFPNHTFYMRPSFKKGVNNETEKIKLSLLAFKDGCLTFSDIWRVMTNLNVIYQIITYKMSLDTTYKYADLFFVTEQIPNEESTVTLSERKDKWGFRIAKVDWRVSAQDIEVMERWYTVLKEQALKEDDYIFTHEFKDINWDKYFTSAAHHVGTARMAHDAENGVIDRDLKVFGVKNLFICDGSVFATSGNVNNGFTISAFACRLAEHIGKLL